MLVGCNKVVLVHCSSSGFTRQRKHKADK